MSLDNLQLRLLHFLRILPYIKLFLFNILRTNPLKETQWNEILRNDINLKLDCISIVLLIISSQAHKYTCFARSALCTGNYNLYAYFYSYNVFALQDTSLGVLVSVTEGDQKGHTYTCFARSAWCTGNYDLYALVLIISICTPDICLWYRN